MLRQGKRVISVFEHGFNGEIPTKLRSWHLQLIFAN